MSHNIDSMAYVGEVPWHGLGVNLGEQDAMIAGERMLRAAGLDWEVKLGAVYDVNGNEIPDYFGVHRLDSGKVLGIVGGRYHPIQNEELFGIPDVLVDEGICGYHTAGSLREGRIVWALAKLGEFSITRLDGSSDPVRRYLLWSSRHDGKGHVVGGFTDVRVVCNNTLDAAMAGGLTNRVKIRHTAGGPGRLAEAHRVFGQILAQGTKHEELFQELASTPFSRDAMREFSETWLDSIGNNSKQVDKRRKEVDELIALFDGGQGNTGESLWDAYNSVTEWLDHHKARYHGATERAKAEKKMESTFFGAAREKKSRALALLRKR